MDHYNERWPIVKTFEPVGDAAPLGDVAGVLYRTQRATHRMQHATCNMPPDIDAIAPLGPFTPDAQTYLHIST